MQRAEGLKMDSAVLRGRQPADAVRAIAADPDFGPKSGGDGAELYHFVTSTCSQRVRIAAAEKGVRYHGHMINFLSFANLTPDYLALNPRGVVPTWTDGEHQVFDSPTIIRFIDSYYAGPALRPLAPAARQEVEHLIDQGDAFPNRYLTYYLMYARGGYDLRAIDIYDWVGGLRQKATAAKAAHPDLAVLYQAKIDDWGDLFDTLQDASVMRRYVDYAETALDDLEDRLAHAEFLGGDEYSLADCCWTTSLFRLESYHRAEFRTWFSDQCRPRLAAYTERMKARESFRVGVVEEFRKATDYLKGDEAPQVRAFFHSVAQRFPASAG